MADQRETQANTEEKRIPVFTVLKNFAILKNIFLINSPPSLSKTNDLKEKSVEGHRDLEETLLVGRHPDCHIRLEHPSISRFHLKIRSKPSSKKLSVTDLSSVHGTWVSGERIAPNSPVDLHEGDLLRIGASSRDYRLHWIPLSLACDVNNPFVPPLDLPLKEEDEETQKETTEVENAPLMENVETEPVSSSLFVPLLDLPSKEKEKNEETQKETIEVENAPLLENDDTEPVISSPFVPVLDLPSKEEKKDEETQKETIQVENALENDSTEPVISSADALHPFLLNPDSELSEQKLALITPLMSEDVKTCGMEPENNDMQFVHLAWGGLEPLVLDKNTVTEENRDEKFEQGDKDSLCLTFKNEDMQLGGSERKVLAGVQEKNSEPGTRAKVPNELCGEESLESLFIANKLSALDSQDMPRRELVLTANSMEGSQYEVQEKNSEPGISAVVANELSGKKESVGSLFISNELSALDTQNKPHRELVLTAKLMASPYPVHSSLSGGGISRDTNILEFDIENQLPRGQMIPASEGWRLPSNDVKEHDAFLLRMVVDEEGSMANNKDGEISRDTFMLDFDIENQLPRGEVIPSTDKWRLPSNDVEEGGTMMVKRMVHIDVMGNKIDERLSKDIHILDFDIESQLHRDEMLPRIEKWSLPSNGGNEDGAWHFWSPLLAPGPESLSLHSLEVAEDTNILTCGKEINQCSEVGLVEEERNFATNSFADANESLLWSFWSGNLGVESVYSSLSDIEYPSESDNQLTSFESPQPSLLQEKQHKKLFKESPPLRSVQSSNLPNIWSRRGQATMSAPQIQSNKTSKTNLGGNSSIKNQRMVEQTARDLLCSVDQTTGEDFISQDKENHTPKTKTSTKLSKFSNINKHQNSEISPLCSTTVGFDSLYIDLEKSSSSLLDKENQKLKALEYPKSTEHTAQGSFGKAATVSDGEGHRMPFQILFANSPQKTVSETCVSGARARSGSYMINNNCTKDNRIRRWSMIVDSTCLLNKKSRNALQRLEGLKGIQLIIPRAVVRELESMKKQASFVRRNTEAFLALEWIEICMFNSNRWIHIQSSVEDGAKSAAPTPPLSPNSPFSERFPTTGWIPFASAFQASAEIASPTLEDCVLTYALSLRRTETDEKLVLLTDDVTLKIKAMAEGLICETAEEFQESLVNPFSERFMWPDSSPRGQSWSCMDDVVLRQIYHHSMKMTPRSVENAKGLKLILLLNSQYRHLSSLR